jgi:hypothetical protein
MKELFILILLLFMLAHMCLMVLAALNPSGALHLVLIHVNREHGIRICAPFDEQCQGNPFGYPVPEELK